MQRKLFHFRWFDIHLTGRRSSVVFWCCEISNFRLVSAYQDKLVDQNYGGYRDYITRNFGGVSFKTFVQMVIERSEKMCQKLSKCDLDRHWRPFISRCGYCTINYKVIAKLETFNEDRKFIGKLADVDFETIGRYVLSLNICC